MLSESSSIIYNDSDINMNSAALLAKELIVFYRAYEDHIKSLSLRELKLITDLLTSYLDKIKCNCLFVDCTYQSSIKDLWQHSLTCVYNPHYREYKKNISENNELVNDVKKKLQEATNLKPYQVDYYTSLTDSYLKENIYIEAKSNFNVSYFQSFKHSTKWKVQDNSYGYSSWIKTEDTGIQSLKTKTIITSPIKKIFYFCDKPESLLEFNKFVVDAYSIRQINTNTRLYYYKTKPGFGDTDFIGIQQVYMKGNTALILRNSLNETESPHKYTPQKEKFKEIRRGFINVEAFEITFVDNITTELMYYYSADYKLSQDFSEVVNGIFQNSLKHSKVIKEIVEKEDLDKREIGIIKKEDDKYLEKKFFIKSNIIGS